MKFALQAPRGLPRTIHFIFTENEARILQAVVGDQVPSDLELDIDNPPTNEEIKSFLVLLFDSIDKCL